MRWIVGVAFVLIALAPSGALAQAQAVVVLANDGRSLARESFETRATFAAVYRDRAATEWVAEHNAQLAIGAVARPFHIAYFSISTLVSNEVNRERFLQGLREAGYRLGQDATVDWRYAEGNTDRLASMAADIVASQPDVIVIGAAPDSLAFTRATSTIPLVSTGVADPVGLGLVTSLDQPGRNLTGVITQSQYGKQVALLKELVPIAALVGVLWNPNNPQAAGFLQEIQQSDEQLGLRSQPLEVRSAAELPGAFDSAAASRVDALIVIGDAAVFGPNQQRIADLAIQKRLALVTSNREFVQNGALISLGVDQAEAPRLVAGYVDKILKGAKSGDLAMKAPVRSEIVLNLKTAQTVGLSVPASVLAKATDVLR